MPEFGYKKMFDGLPAHKAEPADLDKLATAMSGRAVYLDAEEPSLLRADSVLKDKLKPIPAGYTYLAQFITHDISFDEHSDRHRRSDHPFYNVATPDFIKNLKNLRKPNFDLETVYGYEDPANPGETPRRNLMLKNSPLPLLKLGTTEGDLGNGPDAKSYPNDLPRGNACVEARIVDPRNDENLLLAQTLVAFIKFHNAMVVKLAERPEYTNKAGEYKKTELFEKARKLTIRYYQTIVLTDFLPRIVQKKVLKDVIAQFRSRKLFYEPDMFVPLEFSVAAFRFGHSMIRRLYNLNMRHFDDSISPEGTPVLPNQKHPPAALDDLMWFTGRGEMNFITDPRGNCPRLRLPSIWIINWNWFYEMDGSPFTRDEKLRNIAAPIDTELILALLRLRPEVVGEPDDGRPSSLAALDLFRGQQLGLPAGQDVAGGIGATPLTPDQIGELIESKEIKYVTPEKAQEIKERLIEVFSDKTPLWFYILAEAEIQTDGKLGDVGSQIVTETLIHFLYYSEYSILRHEWEADEDFLLKNDEFLCIPEIRTFGMPDMLKFIQKMNDEHFKDLYSKEFYPYDMTDKFDEINPLGDP